MSDWLTAAALVAGFLFTYRRAYVVFSEADERLHDGLTYVKRDGGDRAMCAVVAMLAAALWPVTIVGYVIYRFLTPQTAGERKADLDAREAEIKRMERDLGIGGHR